MRRTCFPTLLAVALFAASCGTPMDSSGTLTIRITDTPFSDARAVIVRFSEVSVHQSGGDWRTVPFADGGGSRSCDLKKLVGAQDVLGTGALGDGHYTQLRLVVSSATLYWDNPAAGSACAGSLAAPAGRNSPVEVPSGEVRLNREFDVATSGATTITLDFDGDRSIRETGNGRYMMTPVVSVVGVQ
jgi:hypothetical protein